jgi:hypothetical protein
MYKFLFIIFLLPYNLAAQELYPYTEPASNMPAHSIAVKLSSSFGDRYPTWQQRYTPEIMFGIDKNLMVHLATTFSDMHTNNVKWESVNTYAQYRFLSNDDVHKHFRMAAFGQAAYSKNDVVFEELNLTGDRSGVKAGLIATQLINKFAASGTVSFIKTFEPKSDHVHYIQHNEAINYSLSTGLLLLPIEYKSYDQTNFNIYMEMLGQKLWNSNVHYLDLAPSVQFIFKSTSKLNVGYKFQIAGDMYRSMNRSIMLSFEHIFLGALKKKTKNPAID